MALVTETLSFWVSWESWSEIAYVETKNLDGETNLKQKIVTEDVSLHFDEKDKVSKSQIDSFRGMEIDCEGPNEFLYNFKGVITS